MCVCVCVCVCLPFLFDTKMLNLNNYNTSIVSMVILPVERVLSAKYHLLVCGAMTDAVSDLLQLTFHGITVMIQVSCQLHQVSCD